MWAVIATFVPGSRRHQASAARGSTRESDEKENLGGDRIGDSALDHPRGLV